MTFMGGTALKLLSPGHRTVDQYSYTQKTVLKQHSAQWCNWGNACMVTVEVSQERALWVITVLLGRWSWNSMDHREETLHIVQVLLDRSLQVSRVILRRWSWKWQATLWWVGSWGLLRLSSSRWWDTGGRDSTDIVQVSLDRALWVSSVLHRSLFWNGSLLSCDIGGRACRRTVEVSARQKSSHL